MKAWAIAFLFTQLVELPIYAIALRDRPFPHRLALGFGASALTHPFVWVGVLAALEWSWLGSVVLAEAFAVLAEAAWLRTFGVGPALRWSLVANGASFALGLASRALFGVP